MPAPSIADRVAVTGGLDSWHTHPIPADELPSIMVADGPHGLRKQLVDLTDQGYGGAEPATCFPPAVSLASTWNPELIDRIGAALGEEAKAMRVGVLLGPGVNIKRDPRCGRNFEYFSEDPHLTGELAAAFVNGVQSQGVGTSLKHFAANNQETDRMRRDSQVDERSLREIYLRGFAKVVTRAQPWTVMCSYNRLNGVKVAENHWLLTEVLRDEWGFEGLVVSDWSAVWDRVASLKAGVDLEMPVNEFHAAQVLAAHAAGRIEEATIDAAYRRVAAVVRRTHAAQQDAPTSFDADTHHELAREAAEQSIVLLANDGALPLRLDANIVVVGEFARTPRYQGAGSSRVNPTRLDNALDAMNSLVGSELPFAAGGLEAVELAKEADVVVAFLGLGEAHEAEGYDRTTVDLPGDQLELLDELLAVNPNVVVVLSNGSSVLVPFRNRVRALVEGWLGGQAGGSAIANVLFGVVNPSGKIAETIPEQLADAPSYLNFPGSAGSWGARGRGE